FSRRRLRESQLPEPRSYPSGKACKDSNKRKRSSGSGHGMQTFELLLLLSRATGVDHSGSRPAHPEIEQHRCQPALLPIRNVRFNMSIIIGDLQLPRLTAV